MNRPYLFEEDYSAAPVMAACCPSDDRRNLHQNLMVILYANSCFEEGNSAAPMMTSVYIYKARKVTVFGI